MAGVKPGDIKRLLILETLSKPVHFGGGMEPITYGGTFTLERVLGTVPVEPDGSAYMQLPPLRSLFFVALDEKGLAVKRMRSFLNVMPGESTTCVGCHESRAQDLCRRSVRPSLSTGRRAGSSRLQMCPTFSIIPAISNPFSIGIASVAITRTGPTATSICLGIADRSFPSATSR